MGKPPDASPRFKLHQLRATHLSNAEQTFVSISLSLNPSLPESRAEVKTLGADSVFAMRPQGAILGDHGR